jgi:hypothetical protein
VCISLSTYIISVTAILCILVTKGLVNCSPIAHRAAASITWSLLNSPQKSQAVLYLFQKYLHCWKNFHSFCLCSFFKQIENARWCAHSPSLLPACLFTHRQQLACKLVPRSHTHTCTCPCALAHRHINFGASFFWVTLSNNFVQHFCSV